MGAQAKIDLNEIEERKPASAPQAAEKKRVQEGISLEMDVMKKISHQCSRLPDMAARLRVLDFLRDAVYVQKQYAIDNGVSKKGPDAGQLGLLE